MTTKKIIPEILAPAGTEDALKAAVNAGCDAVYLGGSLFSARAFAGNFDTESMVRAIEYCHLFGVKLYMTVNTLLKDNEISRLKDYMKPYYEAGLDGVIVQDVGVLRVLRREYPLMPVHGSTQMSISSVYGARLLKNLGITRVVPARELSLAEIRSIRENVDIEIESFVHGAMCYAYSGKCLMSSFLGGRSGNRGRCAQPCRQIYEILSQDGKTRAKEYAMSLKDMCTLSILPKLIDAGIASFKIEGRMKNPNYVAATVAAYKKARDFYLDLCERYFTGKDKGNWDDLPHKAQKEYTELTELLINDMQDIYNRGGFHTGYYFTDKGMVMTANKRPNHMGLEIGEIINVKGPEINIKLCKDVSPQDVLEITPVQVEITSNKAGKKGSTISLKGKELKKIRSGMKVFRTRNNTLLDRIENEIIKPEKQILADAVITAEVGKALSIKMETKSWVNNEVLSVTVKGNIVEKAGSKPADESQLIAKAQKTGGSNVKLNVSCILDQDSFVAMSEFNNLRREALEELKKKVVEEYHRNPVLSE